MTGFSRLIVMDRYDGVTAATELIRLQFDLSINVVSRGSCVAVESFQDSWRILGGFLGDS